MCDIKIAPSILSADFLRLGDEIESVLAAGADLIHFDVMDGVFVPNISVGFPVFERVAERFSGTAKLDVHLMVTRPAEYAARFARLGAYSVSFHVESDAEPQLHSALEAVRSTGALAGLALKPATSASAVLPFAAELQLVTVMTVEPGFGGQSFMHSQLPKIRELRESLPPNVEIEVDGGVNAETARLCADAGASILVAGNAVFGSSDRAATIAALRSGRIA